MFIHTIKWFRNPLDQVRSVKPKLGIELVKFESYPNFTIGVTLQAH